MSSDELTEVSSTNNSFLNYTVVGNSQEPLKIRLKVSKKPPVQNPIVVLEHSIDNSINNNTFEIKHFSNEMDVNDKENDNFFKSPSKTAKSASDSLSHPETINGQCYSPVRGNSPLKAKNRGHALSPNQSPKNKRYSTRKSSKFYYYESFSGSESDDGSFVVSTKRTVKSNQKYGSDFISSFRENMVANDKENYDAIKRTPKGGDSANVRRSNRNHHRMSYASFFLPNGQSSPILSTPKSSTRKKRCSVQASSKCKPINDRMSPTLSAKKDPACSQKYESKDDCVSHFDKVKRRFDDDPDDSEARRDTKLTNLENTMTPRSRLTKKLQGMSISQTPKNGTPKRKVKTKCLTPSLHLRDHVSSQNSTPLGVARSKLHVSYVPNSLPCREKEFSDILKFLGGKLLDETGGCMYISGVPGTGKTATVTSVIKALLEKTKDEEMPHFKFISVNGMKLTEPRQAYVEILKQLTGQSCPWEQAQNILVDKFSKSKKKTEPIIMLIDELDMLRTKRQDVIYNLLDWPTKFNTQLIIIAIANTMDLPERLLMSRVTSRLGLTRLTFQAYTYKQLQEIVTKRLAGIKGFNPDAIQFVARKVASVSGDARRALDICRRAAEIAEQEDGDQILVSMKHVNDALNAMITQPKVIAIKHCSKLEQLILKTIAAEVERTGVEETTVIDIFNMMVSMAALEGFAMVSLTTLALAVSRLGSYKLLLNDPKCNNFNQRIILNVGVDDVHYALKA